ncbi:cytochrome P450 [Rhabdothermincola sediminis]|uniref:cytochrome P450 n=1 Tax=Rhabdothermincola sediminis TaxID=2751370 RepID=UPI001AA07BEE|nr:cytochrome P450 [Rhabdothermincola sediminis]
MAPTDTDPCTTELRGEDVDLSDGALWMGPQREEAFAALRRDLPVSRQRGLPFFDPDAADPVLLAENLARGLPHPGEIEWWAVTRYDDVMHVSRRPDLFASGLGGTNIGDIPQEIAEFLGSMINMDAPRHTKLRKLVNRGFTPRHIARIEDHVREQARAIVDAICEKGEVEFVSEVAAALPLQIICEMMGIPASDQQQIFEWTNTILGVGDPEYVSTFEDLMAAGFGLFQYGLELAEERLANPREDITSTLMHAEVDGERLSASELGSFFVLLVVAGNETTRTAISHGLLQLTRNPDQKQRWLADLDGVSPTAVEEIVRWASPVIHFRRTATEDTVLGDQEIAAGDRVVMFYNSANRDERVFDDPFRLDLTRSPNDHVGFGAGGPHFCLGANLARREIKVMFEELLSRLPDIEVSSAPDMLQSAFIHGIKRMKASFTPRPPLNRRTG